MNALASVYRELVYGGHLLALGTASIAASSAAILGKAPSWDLLLMGYLFSFGAYTVNRWSDFDEDMISHPARTSYLAPRRRVLPAIAIACFGVGYVLSSFRNLFFLLALLLPLALAIAYSISSPKMGKVLGVSRLKEGFIVKNVAISFSWSLIPVLVGLYYLQFPLALFALSPFIFMRLMINTVFFDVRDVEADRKYGIKTLPALLGPAKSWMLMDAIDLASGLYVVTLALSGLIPPFAGILAIFTPYSFAYRYYSRRSSRHVDTLRDLAADGEYIMWGLVVYLGQI